MMSPAFLNRTLFVEKLFQRARRRAVQGYGLMLVMLFLVSTVLIGTSIQMMLGVAASNYLGISSQDNLAAKELADSGMETVLADIQSKLSTNIAITTSYTYSSSNIVMPSDPASLAGGNTTIGSFSGAVTAVSGSSYTVQITATVGSSITTTTRVVNLNRLSSTLDAMTGANAAYGLRQLRSAYTGAAIRVRRSTDSTEQDIGFDSNGNLDLAALNSFLTPIATPPVDSISSTVSVALGLRRLKIAYKGAALKVRRSSDSASQDIGFMSDGSLDVSALLDFVGTGTGYVTTWYDQSGNGTNATQGTTTLQPTIVTSGQLNMVNNRPSIKYDGADDRLSFTRTISDDFSIFACYSVIAGYATYASEYKWWAHAGIVDADATGAANDFGLSVDTSGYLYAGVGTPSGNTITVTSTNGLSPSSAPSPGYNDGRMHWAGMTRVKSTGVSSLYHDNFFYSGPDSFSTNTNTASLSDPATISLGQVQTDTTTNDLNGYIDEVLIYPSSLTDANRRTIQANEGWYYNMAPQSQGPVQGSMDAANVVSSNTPTFAYGLRKLVSSYNGKAIKVRRSSDSTTQDIGFDVNGNLDVSALMTFVGSGSGYVYTWYDQSSNGRNASNSTSGAQPRIVNAGVLETQNGYPTVRFIAANGTILYLGTELTGITNYTASIVSRNISATGDYYVLSGTSYNKQLFRLNNSKLSYFAGTYDTVTPTIADTANRLTTYTLTRDNTGAGTGYVQGATVSFAAASDNGTMYLGVIGALNSSFGFADMYVSEILFYSSVLPPSNILALTQNESYYYSPPLPIAYVTKWYDQSGNGFDATQTDLALQPTLNLPSGGVSNNKPTVTFDGSSFLGTTGGMPVSADYSKNVVFSMSNYASSANILSSKTGASHALFVYGNSAPSYLSIYHTATFTTASIPTALYTNNIACATFLQSSKTGTVYRSNTAVGSATTSTSNTGSTLSIGGFNMGGVGLSLKGTISEALVFNRVLNTSDRTIIYNDERKYFGAQ